MRRLSTYVTVRDAAHRSRTFGPGDDLPAWASQAITFVSAWADTGDDAPQPPAAAAPAPPVTPSNAVDDTVDHTDDSVEHADDSADAHAPRKRGRPRKAN